jgi:hypothetical protein
MTSWWNIKGIFFNQTALRLVYDKYTWSRAPGVGWACAREESIPGVEHLEWAERAPERKEKNVRKTRTSCICMRWRNSWGDFDELRLSRWLDDLIKYTSFGSDQLRGFRSAQGQRSAFPILIITQCSAPPHTSTQDNSSSRTELLARFCDCTLFFEWMPDVGYHSIGYYSSILAFIWQCYAWTAALRTNQKFPSYFNWIEISLTFFWHVTLNVCCCQRNSPTCL